MEYEVTSARSVVIDAQASHEAFFELKTRMQELLDAVKQDITSRMPNFILTFHELESDPSSSYQTISRNSPCLALHPLVQWLKHTRPELQNSLRDSAAPRVDPGILQAKKIKSWWCPEKGSSIFSKFGQKFKVLLVSFDQESHRFWSDSCAVVRLGQFSSLAMAWCRFLLPKSKFHQDWLGWMKKEPAFVDSLRIATTRRGRLLLRLCTWILWMDLPIKISWWMHFMRKVSSLLRSGSFVL